MTNSKIINGKNRIRKRLIKIGFLTNQVYKEANIVKIISDLLFITIQYFIWKAIYAGNNIGLLGFEQMFTYIIISTIIENIYPTQVSQEIGISVKKGDIIFTLLRPFSFIEQLFYQSLGKSLFRLVILNIPFYLLGIFVGIDITLPNLVQFIIITGLTYIYYFIFEIFFGILSFYTISTWGIQNLKYALLLLLSGRVIPIQVYPDFLYKISNLLPFKYFYNIPIITLLGEGTYFFKSVILLVVNIIILYTIYRFLFNKLLRKLTVQGGWYEIE